MNRNHLTYSYAYCKQLHSSVNKSYANGVTHTQEVTHQIIVLISWW